MASGVGCLSPEMAGGTSRKASIFLKEGPGKTEKKKGREISKACEGIFDTGR